MRGSRIETVIQFVSDQDASSRWYARLLGSEPTPYGAPYFKFDEHASLILAPGKPGTGRGGTGCWFLVDSVDHAYKEKSAEGFTFNEPPFDIPPGRLVTLLDPDGNIVGLIGNSKGGMPGQHAGDVALALDTRAHVDQHEATAAPHTPAGRPSNDSHEADHGSAVSRPVSHAHGVR